MYAGCSVTSCDKKSKYLIDVKTSDKKYETHSRCRDHGGFKSKEIACRKDIHKVIIPLSDQGDKTNFVSSCSYCSGKKASEIIRFVDGFDVTTTEARCADCVDALVDSPQDIVSRHTISDVNIRAENCH
jgi:hypothetical protein